MKNQLKEILHELEMHVKLVNIYKQGNEYAKGIAEGLRVAKRITRKHLTS
jgi:hypothetical protein